MKLLRRGASARRKTADAGPVGVGGTLSPARWRMTRVTSTPPKVVTINGGTGSTSSLLDSLRSRTAYKLTLLLVAGILIVGVVLAVTLSHSTSTSEQIANSPSFTEPPIGPPPPERDDPNNTLPGSHRIITKRQWKGRPAKSHPINKPPYALAHPTPYVIISHTATAPCFDPTECSRKCRAIQDDNMGGQFDLTDIASNFLVGGDGNVYEGRGWDVTNTRAGLGGLVSRKNVDVSFIGNFIYDEPTEGQLKAAMELLDLGVMLGKLAPDYKLFSHNDTDAFLSPGKNIFVHIKDWPHYTRPSDASP